MIVRLSKLGQIKMGVHTLQALLVFITACVAIAMDVKQGSSGGAGIFFNIMCYASIPVLIYLTVCPIWESSQKIVNLYAIVALDALWTIFWLSAWAALVSWVRSGLAAGAAKSNIKTSDATCNNGFSDSGFGEAAKCSLANACVGFGVTIWLLWCVSLGISTFWILKAHREPKEEGQDKPWLPEGGIVRPAKSVYGQVKDGEETTDAAWSADMEDQQHNVHTHDTSYGYDDEHDRYPLTSGAAATGAAPSPPADTETGQGRHPGRRWDQPRPFEDDDEEYGAPESHGMSHQPRPQYSNDELPSYSAPSALSPGGYYSSPEHQDTSYGGSSGRPDGNAMFPDAPYGYDRGRGR